MLYELWINSDMWINVMMGLYDLRVRGQRCYGILVHVGDCHGWLMLLVNVESPQVCEC